MKRYLKELILLSIQLLMFYVFPLFAGPTDAMGMVLLILLSTAVLSFLVGILSKEKIRCVYPILISLLFIPSVFIYYNASALIHAVWYLVVSAVFFTVGALFQKIVRRLK